MSKQLPDELRHAFRALLRAATYLPDSVARTYIHNYVVHRFRSVAENVKARNAENAGKLIAKYHDHKRIRTVWQAARKLQRAGEGWEVDLKKVLFLTYGRSGKRRRELVQDLCRPEENTIPEDQAALEKLINNPSETQSQGLDQNKKLQAFLNSQKFNHPTDSPRNKIRNMKLEIPKENIWGRPMPVKRQKNIQKRFWADLLDKVMPPVPRYEWERLRDLATGTISLDDHPPRRSRAQEPQETEEEVDQKLLEYFSKPTNWQSSNMKKFDIGTDNIVTQWEARTNPHVKGLKDLTPRYMRRLYAMIWGITPTMSQDEVTKTWTTTWGGGRSAAHDGMVIAPSASDLELFEGADEQVKCTGGPTSRRERRKAKATEEKHKGQGRLAPRMPRKDWPQGIVPVIRRAITHVDATVA